MLYAGGGYNCTNLDDKRKRPCVTYGTGKTVSECLNTIGYCLPNQEALRGEFMVVESREE